MKFFSKKIIFSLCGALTSGIIFSTLFSTAFTEGPTGFAPPPTIVPTGAPQSLEAVLELLSTLSGWMFAFVLVIGVGAIIVGGIMYVTSAGSKRADTATKIVIYALIGVIVAGFAWAMINIVGSLVFNTKEQLIPTSGGDGDKKSCLVVCASTFTGRCYNTIDECLGDKNCTGNPDNTDMHCQENRPN